MRIVHEDKNFLIIEKPAGQLVLPIPKSPETTLRDEILEKYPEIAEFDKERAGIVHRLDRETSGLIIVARALGALRFFQGEFGARRIKKEYLALAHGVLKKDRDIIDLPLGRSASGKIVPHPVRKKEREAITEYEVLERFKNFTLLRILPRTGRMHQIRAHLAAIGHPLFGDKLYATKSSKHANPLFSYSAEYENSHKTKKSEDKKTESSRLFLHASKLEFFDPDAKWRAFSSPLPEELLKTLTSLDKYDSI